MYKHTKYYGNISNMITFYLNVVLTTFSLVCFFKSKGEHVGNKEKCFL